VSELCLIGRARRSHNPAHGRGLQRGEDPFLLGQVFSGQPPEPVWRTPGGSGSQGPYGAVGGVGAQWGRLQRHDLGRSDQVARADGVPSLSLLIDTLESERHILPDMRTVQDLLV
jgi:hypothetical protein